MHKRRQVKNRCVLGNYSHTILAFVSQYNTLHTLSSLESQDLFRLGYPRSAVHAGSLEGQTLRNTDLMFRKDCASCESAIRKITP